MAKKILAGIGIVLACALLFVVGCTLIMFLAPGVEIFGIRYVAVGQGQYYFNDKMESFSGDVYIETKEVPITVKYVWGINRVQVEYKQDFIGFTSSPKLDEQLESFVENGDLHIVGHDTEKFLYSHQNIEGDSAFMIVSLPQSFTGKQVHVKGESSDIVFNAAGSAEQWSVDIDTAGTVSIAGNLSANTLTIKTKQLLTVGTNVSVQTLNIIGGANNITVKDNVAQTLNVETGNGSLIVGEARVLNFKSTSGALKAPSEDKLNFSSGNIETYSGSIKIDNITGTETTVIKTTVGNVDIKQANSLEITNTRSATTIEKVGDCKINGGIGIVTIVEATSSLDVETRNGYVYLGSTEKSVTNPTVETSTGKIFASNVSGKLNLTSKNNSVDINASNVVEATIKSGDAVKAKGLKGNIVIECDGELDLEIEKLSGNIDIKTSDNCKKVNVKMLEVELSTFNYDFTSSKARKAYVYAGEELALEPSSLLKTETVNADLKTVKIATTYADMYIYTK